jgi:hypothetical protein
VHNEYGIQGVCKEEALKNELASYNFTIKGKTKIIRKLKKDIGNIEYNN